MEKEANWEHWWQKIHCEGNGCSILYYWNSVINNCELSHSDSKLIKRKKLSFSFKNEDIFLVNKTLSLFFDLLKIFINPIVILIFELSISKCYRVRWRKHSTNKKANKYDTITKNNFKKTFHLNIKQFSNFKNVFFMNTLVLITVISWWLICIQSKFIPRTIISWNGQLNHVTFLLQNISILFCPFLIQL